jgi:maleate cis-trans isomerase
MRNFYKIGYINGMTNHTDEMEQKVMTPADVVCHKYPVNFFFLPKETHKIRERGTGLASREEFQTWHDQGFEQVFSTIKYTLEYQGGAQGGPFGAFAIWSNGFSSWRGREHNLRAMDQISKVVDAPTTSATDGMARACQELGVKRVAWVGPYESRTQGVLFEEYMRTCGVSAVFHASLGLRGHKDLQEQPSLKDLHHAITGKGLGDAEALCLLNTSIFYADSVDALERELGRPVFAAGPVTLWAALRIGGYKRPIYGFGTLLAQH